MEAAVGLLREMDLLMTGETGFLAKSQGTMRAREDLAS